MKDLLDTFDYGYTIQDLKKILNHAVKDYEVEFGEPDKIIDTIYDMGYGYRLLENQCRIYLKSKSLVFVTIGCIYIIPFDKIIGYEVVNLKENAQPLYSATTTTTTTDTGNVIKRAVIGGALAGGVGAIIGGTTAKTITNQQTNMFDYLNYLPNLELRINIDDILSPSIKIPFDQFREEAEETAASLNVIIKRNADNNIQEDTKILVQKYKIDDLSNSIGIAPHNPLRKLNEEAESNNSFNSSGSGCSIIVLIGISLTLGAMFLL